jgi:hypothetical protein
MHDMELFNQVSEGSEYSFKRPKQGANKTLTIKKWGLGFSISKEAVDDGKFDLISDATAKLADSAKESQEVYFMDLFNSGFSGGSHNTADGVSIFNSAHTLPSGGTFRNTLSSNSDLSETTLQTAMSDFETVFVGDSGIYKRYMPKILLVHPSSKRYAQELVGSDGKPDTSDNNLNSLKSDGLIVVSSPHLTDTDAWFVLAATGETGMRIVERKALATESDMAGGFATDSMRYKASYREERACVHPYGVIGTPGA